MANLVTQYTIANTGWTKIGSAITGLYIETRTPGLQYYIRLLDSGDTAPTDAVNLETDLLLFSGSSYKDEIATKRSCDVYCRVTSGSGVIKTL